MEVVVPEIVDAWHWVYLFYTLQYTYIFLKTKNLTGKIDKMLIWRDEWLFGWFLGIFVNRKERQLLDTYKSNFPNIKIPMLTN